MGGGKRCPSPEHCTFRSRLFTSSLIGRDNFVLVCELLIVLCIYEGVQKVALECRNYKLFLHSRLDNDKDLIDLISITTVYLGIKQPNKQPNSNPTSDKNDTPKVITMVEATMQHLLRNLQFALIINPHETCKNTSQLKTHPNANSA